MKIKRLIGALAGAVVTTVVLSSCGFTGLYGVTLPGGANVGSHPFQVTVEFADVLDLVPQSAVKVNDVSVGRVESIKLVGWHAQVTVLVNGSVDLPANARAVISQTSLLGEKYVALLQPNSAPPTGRLTNGADIPLSRTSSNVEIEQVLGALSLLLNGGGLPQIATITTELNKALKGRTSDVRSLLGQLDTLTKSLDDQKATIVSTIEKVNNLAATLDAQKQVLTATLDTMPGALTVLANERDQLVGLLTGLNTLSQQAVGVMNASTANLQAGLVALQPTLEQLTAAGKNLGNGFELFATYPFPRTAPRAIGGDYTNLIVTMDGSLTDLLSNLSTSTCPPGDTANCQLNSPAPGLQGGAPVIPIVPGA